MGVRMGCADGKLVSYGTGVVSRGGRTKVETKQGRRELALTLGPREVESLAYHMFEKVKE